MGLLVTLFAATPAQAALLLYHAAMNGPSEAPPNASPGIGTVYLDFDDVANTMRIRTTFSGLTGNTTAAHIHANVTATPFTGTSGVATTTPTFVGFPQGVTSGSSDNTYDMTIASSYNAAFVTANGGTIASARAALLTAIATGRAYYNVHTQTFTGGEIRGFLVVVPEPSSMALLGTFAAGAGWRAWRRRKAKQV
ncbi:MAG: CHRD domain-containing protein [Pirellulaceae bacterium]|nr:CHRD domain-containing protein [Pirellulaceae bacterium]